MRRLRRTQSMRGLVRETVLSPQDFIFPLFVTGEENIRRPMDALPGMSLLSGGHLREEARAILESGVPAVLLFGIPEQREKDDGASLAYLPDGPAQKAVREIKAAAPQLTVITDLCLCEYTRHGHCGLLKDGEIDNDLTLECIQETALAQARAGCDVVAPSGMMDGMVRAIREVLDPGGWQRVLTMPYSAKFASQLYGPFKEVTRSAPGESKHATHQLDVANARQALTEISLDLEEGADIVIVKPAAPSLDIIARARQRFDAPIAAYQVSGEYNMLLGASAGDASCLRRLVLESLTSIKRAGADMIITYFALEAAGALQG